MRAIDRTTNAFVASVLAALPDAQTQVDRSVNRQGGRSNYVYIYAGGHTTKVRISDHAVGMRRAMFGNENLLMHAGATIDDWSVWLAQFVRRMARRSSPGDAP